MSIPAQGAEGAETMTAEYFAKAIVKAWDALPDGQHTMRTVERWLINDVQPVVFQARAALATPAQPAGAVPDSLREVPEGAIHNGREHLRRLGLYGFTANDGHALDRCEDYIGAQQCFEVMAEALASHPAGQSAGTGAGQGDPCAWAGGNDTCYCRTCGEEYRYGPEDKPACPRKPAPDSTRTGQVGVPDIVRSAVANAAAADGFANGPAAKHYAALRALEWVETLLAARPAAPEAQGAEWRRNADLRERAAQTLAACEIDQDVDLAQTGAQKAHYDAIDAIMKVLGFPAPPASSGQGGR